MIGRFFSKLIWFLSLPLFSFLLFIRRKMRESKFPDEGNGKIVITKFDAIGDYALLRNFLKALKEDPNYGNYHITLIGNILWEDLSKKFDVEFLDETIFIYPEKLRTNLSYRIKTLWSLQSKSYEILLAPTLSRKFLIDESVTFAIRAKKKITQMSDLLNMKSFLRWQAKFFYHEIYDLDPKKTEFEFVRNRLFFEKFTGNEMAIISPKFFDDEENLPLVRKYSPKYVLFAPGAGQESRRWPVLHFIRLGRYILDQTPFHIVIMGPKGDLEIGREIQNRLNTHQKVFNSIGKMSLVDTISLLHHAEFVVSNETGTVHLGASLSKFIFCPSNGQHFGRFHPYPPYLAKPCHYFYPLALTEEIKKAVTQEDFEKIYQAYKKGSPFNVDDVLPEGVIDSIQKTIF